MGAADGTFRGSFEDKLLKSDIVFLRSWVTVELPRYWNPVTNMMHYLERDQRQIKRAALTAEGGEDNVPDVTGWQVEYKD